MKTHYRSLTSEQLAELIESLSEHYENSDTGETVSYAPSEYDALASFQAVRVGNAGDGPLPADVPSRDVLIGAGVDTIGKARPSRDLTNISGIGAATQEKIRAKLPPDELVVHVAGPDREGLPGTYLGETLQVLGERHRKATCRAWIRRVDAEGNEVEDQVPESEIPEGAVVIETGLNPHAFA